MIDPYCTGSTCTQIGNASGATPGCYTKTAGYISNTEIRDILANNPTAKTFTDWEKADILIYNDDQWVSYMDENTKARRINMYRAMSFLRTADWAVSLDEFNLVDEDDYGDDNEENPGDFGLERSAGLVFDVKDKKVKKEDWPRNLPSEQQKDDAPPLVSWTNFLYMDRRVSLG